MTAPAATLVIALTPALIVWWRRTPKSRRGSSGRAKALAAVSVWLTACYPTDYREGSNSQAVANPTPDFPVAWNGATSNPAPAAAQRAAPVPAPAPAPAAPAPVKDAGLVAVMPVNAREANMDSATLMTFDEAVRTVTGEVLTPIGYTVLTSETTLTVLRDNGIDPNKACEASCALEAARELKAKLFVSTTVAKTEGQYVAFVRLFENTGGKQLGAVELDGDTVREIRKQLADKAPQLFARIIAP